MALHGTLAKRLRPQARRLPVQLDDKDWVPGARAYNRRVNSCIDCLGQHSGPDEVGVLLNVEL